MKKPYFKWYPHILDESDGDDPVLFMITEEMIQDMAEANINRRLTKKEMHRAFYSFIEDFAVMGRRDETILEAINSSVSNKNNEWAGIDEEFLEKQALEREQK